MKRNQSLSRVAIHSAMNASSSFTSIKWLSARMIRSRIMQPLRTYQSITQSWQPFQWVSLFPLMPVEIQMMLMQTREQLWDSVIFILLRKWNSIARMTDKCFVLNVFLNTRKWSMRLFRFLQKLMKWRKWSKKWSVKLRGTINPFLSTKSSTISLKWKLERSSMKK